MRLKILNESEKIITNDIKDVKTDIFPVDDNNRNWLVTFWKVRIIALNADRLTIQFFDHVCYNSEKESIEKKYECVRWFLKNFDFNLKAIITRASLKESLIKC